MKQDLGRWHRAYIKNAYRELERGTTRKQIDALGINATRKKVLDVGCGAGNLLVALALDAPSLLVGVDVDMTFLEFTPPVHLRHNGEIPIRKLRAGLPALPFKNETFDLVTCFLVMPHVPEDKAALTELARVLKPGGTLALSGHGFGFPLSYLKRLKLKPLIMYLATLIYRCTGKKWIRNTLQSDKKVCDILRSIGMSPDRQLRPKKTFGHVTTYCIRAMKNDTSPSPMQ